MFYVCNIWYLLLVQMKTLIDVTMVMDKGNIKLMNQDCYLAGIQMVLYSLHTLHCHEADHHLELMSREYERACVPFQG